MKTIASIIEKFPPSIIRMLAREGRGSAARRLTHEQIAERSGLSYEKVRTLSRLSSWDSVKISDADAFMAGCGINIGNLWRHRAYLFRSLDPRKTKDPLGFTRRSGASQRPPDSATIVAAALAVRRKRPKIANRSTGASASETSASA